MEDEMKCRRTKSRREGEGEGEEKREASREPGVSRKSLDTLNLRFIWFLIN